MHTEGGPVKLFPEDSAEREDITTMSPTALLGQVKFLKLRHRLSNATIKPESAAVAAEEEEKSKGGEDAAAAAAAATTPATTTVTTTATEDERERAREEENMEVEDEDMGHHATTRLGHKMAAIHALYEEYRWQRRRESALAAALKDQGEAGRKRGNLLALLAHRLCCSKETLCPSRSRRARSFVACARVHSTRCELLLNYLPT